MKTAINKRQHRQMGSKEQCTIDALSANAKSEYIQAVMEKAYSEQAFPNQIQ